MLNRILVTISIFIFISIPAYAEMLLFVGEDCSKCQALQLELTGKNLYEAKDIKVYEVYHNQENANLYLQKSKELNYTNGGVPLLVDGDVFVEGRTPILAYLEAQTMPEKTTLTKEDSKNLNAILADANLDEKGTRQIGLFIIILGVSIGLSVMGLTRLRRKK